MNIILNDREREIYQWRVNQMKQACPAMMSRKIERANVQQAWMLDSILNLIGDSPKEILCVGSFEDTACATLEQRGLNIHQIDPLVNRMNLDDYCGTKGRPSMFDIVFATSVIEHVPKDEPFLRDMIYLLKSGGYGLITCDFKPTWKAGEPVPYTNHRFYTRQDMEGRLSKAIKDAGCELVGKVNWDSTETTFVWEGIPYAFATMLFRKR